MNARPAAPSQFKALAIHHPRTGCNVELTVIIATRGLRPLRSSDFAEERVSE
jgi:hypothetical protein